MRYVADARRKWHAKVYLRDFLPIFCNEIMVRNTAVVVKSKTTTTTTTTI